MKVTKKKRLSEFQKRIIDSLSSDEQIKVTIDIEKGIGKANFNKTKKNKNEKI